MIGMPIHMTSTHTVSALFYSLSATKSIDVFATKSQENKIPLGGILVLLSIMAWEPYEV